MAAADADFIEMIRAISACRQRAERMRLGFLTGLLTAALLEAAMQWDGGTPVSPDVQAVLPKLLATKIKLALANGSVHPLD
jgi:hypothetical protein